MAYDRNDRGGYGGERGGSDYARDHRDYRGNPEDRGFFERAGDEVRSWFGDDEAERRRRMDERYDERYDRERYAGRERGGYRAPDANPDWYRSNRDDVRRGRNAGQYGYQSSRGGEGYRFRDEGRGYAGDYRGNDGSERAPGRDRAAGYADDYARGYNRDSGRDEHGYGRWRDRQISSFDRDYDEYRRENQSRFESEFATWRQNRQTQRDSMGTVKEHQEVVGSDGAHVGTVDHVRSDHILLTKNDKDAGGHHHAIPSSWIASVGDKVQLNRTAADAKRAWSDTEGRGGMFGGDRDDDRQSGHGQLNRSFSGTY